MNKLVIFDLDGTLLDTLPEIENNINIMRKHFSMGKLGREGVRKAIGRGVRNLVFDSIDKSLPIEKKEECLTYFKGLYVGSKNNMTALFDGIDELLLSLKERGFLIAILTNKPQPVTENVYSQFLSKYNFDRVIGEQNGVKCKPDKTSTINLLKELNVEPNNCYFVGDGETDAITAINAGVNGISVLWGYRTKEELSVVGAKVFAEKPSDLLYLIK